jgi:hypothetical protein
MKNYSFALICFLIGLKSIGQTATADTPVNQPTTADTTVNQPAIAGTSESQANNGKAPSLNGVSRQSPDDAWWTGPLLTPSPSTLPHGHFLAEPYLFTVISPHSNYFGSLTYILYGLANRLTVGCIPTAGFTSAGNGRGSSGLGFGDITALAQYRLTLFHPGGRTPTISLVLEESFPTGKYDRLGLHPGDGLGSGAYTTTLALYSQTSFWLPNGRILRMRLDGSLAFPTTVKVDGVSVYGTAEGFYGQADPGSSGFVNASWEYSLTRSWVLALDLTYRHNGNTSVTGSNPSDTNGSPIPPTVELNSGTSDSFGFAPAIEYSWKPNLGVILGVRVIPAGHNTTQSITPAVAINFVY